MNSAIILAGGRGKRMNSKVSKQYIDINGKPILYYTIKKFMDCDSIDNIVVVVPKDEIEYFEKEIVIKYDLKVDLIVAGGTERQDSVFNGLKAIKNTDIVLIHDGARPFLSKELIEKGIEFVKIHKSVAPGVMPKDTIKVKDENSFSKETLNRSSLVAVQTPQIFDYNLIFECHKKVKEDKAIVTDDTSVAELYGNKVFLYEGEYTNIKITTPEDLVLARYLAETNL
ncbi:2-C-methyl-D-erythritol 4-phosphate cytidylyltransferase [Clostridium thermobutyricum]|uniref:2-C-methyl-D-erythritol 4-phosphate cytidylyltransferase n=1 Tax=Clostridium thermobutyricum TaxID=29372 RepID=UPI0018AA2541|nr:2-C-methyl-D-erythritol 4-phosphate cytidylyltransferase [Clostridium thermobutyricum]